VRVKYGYKNFAAKILPRPHPKRPFDKMKDFKPSMNLFVYLTPTGLVAKHPRDLTSNIIFSTYTSDGLAYIWIESTHSWKVVNPERIHIKENN
jgi:hypothetical protein